MGSQDLKKKSLIHPTYFFEDNLFLKLKLDDKTCFLRNFNIYVHP